MSKVIMRADYPLGSIVWARIGTNWWPGTVTNADSCPLDFMKSIKKKPLLIVKFFNEQDFFDIHKQDMVLPYNCSRKEDLIKKGLNSLKNDGDLSRKFEDDVTKAEKLSGGNLNIVKDVCSKHKRKIDYADMGFGIPKPKKTQKDESIQKEGFTNIGEAIQYKKGFSGVIPKRSIEHEVRILEQPKSHEGDMKSESNWYKCSICAYTCVRLDVIVWHDKTHLKKVIDYDSGIKVPGRRKRKQQTPKSRSSKLKSKVAVINKPPETNGHSLDRTSELLRDWEDEEEDECNRTHTEEAVNGTNEDVGSDCENGVRNERQPMPDQKYIDSAFDALLADSSGTPLSTDTTSTSHFANNDSDSECSDWEKYYDSEFVSPNRSPDSTTHQNGLNGPTSPNSADENLSDLKKSPSNNHMDKVPNNEESSETTEASDTSQEVSTTGTSSKDLKEDNICTATVSDKTVERTPISSTGPAYMLVAVDAQGNNVPMPVLSEGGSNLVAVEASMEDGSTRRLYIDPAHLGPNVDLNNLMLHIDNTGEETVYIASSNDSESSCDIEKPKQNLDKSIPSD